MNGDIRPPRAPKTNRPKPNPAPAPKPHGLDSDMPLPEITIDLSDNPKPKRLKYRFFHKFINFLPIERWYSLSRRWKFITAGGVALILIVAGSSVYQLFIKKSPQPVVKNVVKAAPKINTVASPLTGVQVDPKLATRPVTAIMIENSVFARPQSGIQDAGVVFEAIAEGGITRFITLYQDTQPQYIGPVRSLRPYYIDFATPFDASVAHVGGSPDALAQIRSADSGVIDLDQFFNADYYWRQTSREAPHNVYTSFEKLDGLNQLKGHLTSKFTAWARKKDEPLKSPAAGHIDLNVSSGDFNVHYDWDAATNTYLRSEGGKPHMASTTADDSTAQQLHPKVVIAPVMSYSVIDSNGHSGYGVDEGGSVFIFQDGGVIQGTWSKAGRGGQFEFKDNSGNDIKLNAGQTWVTIVQAGQVSYAP